ncbi:MAG TPA: SEC-C metal-binding domain-containing protein, partial [Thermoanaerobaculia bacterium]
RRDILEGREGREYLLGISRDVLDFVVDTHCPERADPADWELSQLATDVLAYFDIDVHQLGLDLESLGRDALKEELWRAAESKYEDKERRLEAMRPDLPRLFERDVMLRVLDQAWKDHLLALDHLKEGIGLRGYGQRDPKQEYKRESFELFQEMKERVEDQVIKTLFRLEPVSEEQLAEQRRRRTERAPAQRFQFTAPAKTSAPQKPATVVNKGDKVGRNDPCPCGSGKKYKKCHGAAAAVGA